MTLNETIAKIANDMCVTYIFDDMSRINIKADNAPSYPAILRSFPETGAEGTLKNNYKVDWNIVLFFCDKCPLDFDTPKDIVPIIDNMLRLWVDFRQRLFKHGYKFNQVNIQQFADKLDVNVAGIAVHLNIEDNTGICLYW